jgi:hypothetical protein
MVRLSLRILTNYKFKVKKAKGQTMSLKPEMLSEEGAGRL